MKKNREAQEFLIKKRTLATYQKRAWRLRLRLKKRESGSVYESTSLSALAKVIPARWKKLRSRYVVSLPENFSILNNPEGSLTVILRLANRLRAGKLKDIQFDHSNVSAIDLAAESLLDCVALEYQSESRARRRRVRYRGFFPKSENIKSYIRAVGLIKNLDVKHELLPKDEEDKRKILKLRHRLASAAYDVASTEHRDKVIEDLIDHFNECLKEEGFVLTTAGAHRLGLYAGEVLENISEHSGRDDWYVCGYMDTTESARNYEVVIFNFGATIAETLDALPKDSFAAKEIQPFLERHSQGGLFSVQWRKEDLLTLVALQGHISRKRTLDDPDRGQGSVHLIEFFQRIHEQCTNGESNDARMALLSGGTFILFDGKYKLNEDESKRKIIAFNEKNSLAEKPDPIYVRPLKGVYFPGTILCIRFPMHASQIERVAP